MDTMPVSAASASGLSTGFKIISALIAIGVVIQAWLGSSGLFQGEPGRVDLHGYIANAFFLLVVVQAALAFGLMQKGILGRNALILSGVTVLLTFAQIGLGYSTRNGENFSTAISWHIPVGVALMGSAAILVAIAWSTSSTSKT